MTCVSPEAAAALQEALAQTTNHFSNGIALSHQSLCRALSSIENISSSCALQLSSSRVSMVTSLRRCDAAQAEMLMSRDYLATNDCRGSLNALLKLLNTSCDVVESYAFKLQQRNITRTRLPSSIHKTADAISKTAESITAGVASLASKAPSLHRLHLSRAADADDVSARLEPITAVVVHAPPFEQKPADDTELDDNVLKGESAVGGLKEENAVVDSSSFSLYSMLKRWNKEGDDTQRLQEFQEQPTLDQEAVMGSGGVGLMQAAVNGRGPNSSFSRAKARSRNSGGGSSGW